MGNLDEDACHKLNHQEDALVNHRLTWLPAGQPLLFLAYATAATAKRGQNEELLSEAARQAALNWIPVAGIIMALAIWIGMWGAAVAMVKLHHPRVERFAAILTGVLLHAQ